MAARLCVRAAGRHVSPALQHQPGPGALPCGLHGQSPVSGVDAQGEAQTEPRRPRARWRLADRLQGPGPAHSRNLATRNGGGRCALADGQVFRRGPGSDGDRVVTGERIVTDAEAKFLLDPYLDWTKKEGPPIHEDFGVDLLTAETGPWPRLGDRCKAAFVHLKGRGDWTTVF